MPHRKRHRQGYFFGILFSLVAIIFFLIPSSEIYLVSGPMLPGHEELECLECHKGENGTFRQQLQANVQYLINNRKKFVSVGLRPVENNECLKCHERPNDNHPVYRFREQKYRKVREKIQADSCNACHLEHNKKRISVTPTFCIHCHGELKLKDDPIDVSHQQLVKEKKWDSCLTCHDFHGNHNMKVENKIANGITLPAINKYFNRGNNPYPGEIINRAKNDNKK